MMTTSPSLKSRAESRVHSMLNGLGDTAHRAEDGMSAQSAALERRMSAAWEQMRQLEEGAARRARMAALTTDHYVHEHPWQLILAAAVIGFAAGALVATRRRPQRMRVH